MDLVGTGKPAGGLASSDLAITPATPIWLSQQGPTGQCTVKTTPANPPMLVWLIAPAFSVNWQTIVCTRQGGTMCCSLWFGSCCAHPAGQYFMYVWFTSMWVREVVCQYYC